MKSYSRTTRFRARAWSTTNSSSWLPMQTGTARAPGSRVSHCPTGTRIPVTEVFAGCPWKTCVAWSRQTRLDMRIFITGVSGLFGLNAALVLGDKGHEVWGSYLTHPVELPGGRAVRLDVREGVEVLRVFRDIKPEVVIHAAAYTSVDACEEDPRKAKEINVGATRAVVKAVADFDVRARLVHLSTDQVFDGKKPLAKESMPRVPVNEYGRTKLESESVLQSEDVAGPRIGR